MGWFKLSFFYTFLSTLVATSFAANCYSPDGSDRNLHSDVAEGTVLYTPCSQVTRFSMCCRQPNDGGDDCRSDGLCQGYATDGSLPIWRESCTDRSWQSPYCLNLCTTGINEDGNDNHAGDTIVIQCKDDSWCCGATNGTCCDRGDGKWIVNGRITDTNPKLQTSTTSSSFTSSSISSASTSTITPAGESSNQNSLPSPDPQPSSGSNNAGAIAGGVVGGVAVLAILAAAIWFFRRRARNDREQQQQKQQESPPPEQPPPMAPSTIPQPNTISIGGLHEAFAPTNEKDPAHLDSRERFEIGYQDKDKNNRQELAA